MGDRKSCRRGAPCIPETPFPRKARPRRTGGATGASLRARRRAGSRAFLHRTCAVLIFLMAPDVFSLPLSLSLMSSKGAVVKVAPG